MFSYSIDLVRKPLLENGEANINWLNCVSGAYAQPLYFMLLDTWEPMHPDNVPAELEKLRAAGDAPAVVVFILKLYALNRADVPLEVLDILECPSAVLPFAYELIADFKEIIEEENDWMLEDEA